MISIDHTGRQSAELLDLHRSYREAQLDMDLGMFLRAQ
jgi:hypothetical protein